MKMNLEIIKSIVDEEVQDFSPLHKGENDSYMLKTPLGWNLVLKLYRLNRLERIDAKTEIELTQLLRSKGVLTSEHVKFSTGKYIESIAHQTMSLQRLIDGYMLSRPREDDYRKYFFMVNNILIVFTGLKSPEILGYCLFFYPSESS